jgi:hypothetical protein
MQHGAASICTSMTYTSPLRIRSLGYVGRQGEAWLVDWSETKDFGSSRLGRLWRKADWNGHAECMYSRGRRGGLGKGMRTRVQVEGLDLDRNHINL